MIKIHLIGHLGKDAVINNVNGRTVINFSVAHTSTYKNAQGHKIDNTIWVNCALWRDNIGVFDYLKKGTQVYVAGDPTLNTYTNASREIVPQLNLKVLELQLLTSSTRHSTNQPQTGSQNDLGNNYNEPIDDLPF